MPRRAAPQRPENLVGASATVDAVVDYGIAKGPVLESLQYGGACVSFHGRIPPSHSAWAVCEMYMHRLLSLPSVPPRFFCVEDKSLRNNKSQGQGWGDTASSTIGYLEPLGVERSPTA